MSASDLEQIQHIRSAEYPECCSPQSAAFVSFERVRLNADEGQPGRTESASCGKVTQAAFRLREHKRGANQLEIPAPLKEDLPAELKCSSC